MPGRKPIDPNSLPAVVNNGLNLKPIDSFLPGGSLVGQLPAQRRLPAPVTNTNNGGLPVLADNGLTITGSARKLRKPTIQELAVDTPFEEIGAVRGFLPAPGSNVRGFLPAPDSNVRGLLPNGSSMNVNLPTPYNNGPALKPINEFLPRDNSLVGQLPANKPQGLLPAPQAPATPNTSNDSSAWGAVLRFFTGK